MAYGLTQSADLELSSSQYLSRADTAVLDLSGALSIEMWVNLESAPSNNNFTFASKFENTSGQNQRSYWFRYNDTSGTKTLQLVVSQDGTSSVQDLLSVSQTLTTGTWYHVAVTWLGSSKTAKFYVNGSQVGGDQVGTAVSTLFNCDAPFAIGAVSPDAASNFFDGKVSLVRLWNDVRTDSEIANNQCNVFGTAESGMVGEWSLNNVLTDASGNGLTLTNNNSATFVSDVPAVCVSTPFSNVMQHHMQISGGLM